MSEELGDGPSSFKELAKEYGISTEELLLEFNEHDDGDSVVSDAYLAIGAIRSAKDIINQDPTSN